MGFRSSQFLRETSCRRWLEFFLSGGSGRIPELTGSRAGVFETMAGTYDPAIVKQISDLLTREDMGPLSIWNDVKKILLDEGIAYEVPVVCPSRVLCHTENRGGLGLNPKTCHRTGARILRIGCDRDELEKTVSMELHPSRSEEQFRFNRELVERSAGLLAPVSGNEKHLTLGGGHATAFFKAVLAGCVTSEATLKDIHGKLSKDRTIGSVALSGCVRALLTTHRTMTTRGVRRRRSHTYALFRG